MKLHAVKTIELSLDPQYLNWNIDVAVRDLMQNAIDGQTAGFPMSVTYDEASKRLSLKNAGARLETKNLLLGNTTKRGDTAMIGQYGEGMKLSALAVLKSDRTLTIRNGDEVWRPVIRFSEQFQNDVLAFDIESLAGDAPGPAVEVIVDGLWPEEWDRIRGQFLCYETGVTAMATPHGQVLLNPEFAGAVYVGGILVERIKDEKLAYGYNMNPGAIPIDRDRKMTSRWELKYKSAQMWVFLAESSDDMFQKLETMLIDSSADVYYLSNTYLVPAQLKQRLKEQFHERFGKRAHPVTNQDDAKLAASVGVRGMVFGESYVKLLAEQMPTLSEMVRNYDDEIMARFEAFDLNDTERANLHLAWSMATAVLGAKLPEMEIVAFRKDEKLGLCKQEDGVSRIFIGRNALQDFEQALQTVIHESCHAVFSCAHDMQFLAGLDATWAALCRKIWERSVMVMSQPTEAARSRPAGVTMIGLDVHDDIAVEGEPDETPAREHREVQIKDICRLNTQSELRDGETIHGYGEVVKVHDALPEKKMCRGCYNNDYNHGLGGAKECWSFEKAVVVDKVGYSSIHVCGGMDTLKKKTLDCWHAVSK